MLEYRCQLTKSPPRLDGCLSGSAWDAAPWTTDFRDILATGDVPYYKTRCKMLYDDTFLYVGAYLEDKHVWGTLTEDQSVIFHDNDFEIFLDPDGSGINYYEFEVNALGATWQLTLDKPYKDGGCAKNMKLPGLVSNVYVDGVMNDPSSVPVDRGWSVTVALPLTELVPFGARQIVPGQTSWRANFSRVHWEHHVVNSESSKPAYERVPPHGTELPQGSNQWHPEKNWVWCHQNEVNMHAPDTWGFIRFV